MMFQMMKCFESSGELELELGRHIPIIRIQVDKLENLPVIIRPCLES
jgi:hypothetical protein